MKRTLGVLLGLIMLGAICSLSGWAGEAAKPVKHRLAVADYGGGKIALVDENGQITWQHRAVAPQDVWVLPSGNILYCENKAVREITRDKRVIWEYKTDPQNEIQSCHPLPNGNVLAGELGPCRLIELNRKGEVVKAVPVKVGATDTHGQFRMARKTPQGTYIVGCIADGEVREINERGELVKVLLKDAVPYGGQRLASGNTLVSAGEGHRLVELDPSGKVVWELKDGDLPGLPLRFIAGAQRRPGGNTIVCNWGGFGHIGQQAQVFEVTPDKKVVWQIFDNKQFGTITNVKVLDAPKKAKRGGKKK